MFNTRKEGDFVNIEVDSQTQVRSKACQPSPRTPPRNQMLGSQAACVNCLDELVLMYIDSGACVFVVFLCLKLLGVYADVSSLQTIVDTVERLELLKASK